jgi:hypothetical protein
MVEKPLGFREARSDQPARTLETVRGVFRGDVELHAVARRDDHRFTQPWLLRELARGLRNATIGDREALTRFDRCFVVAESDAKNLHRSERLFFGEKSDAPERADDHA